MGQRKFELAATVVLRRLGRPGKQLLGKFFRGRGGEAEGANFFVGGLVVAAQLLGEAHSRFRKVFHELQPAIAGRQIRPAGLHHLRGDLRGNAGHDRVEARYVPRLRDLRDDRLAFA